MASNNNVTVRRRKTTQNTDNMNRSAENILEEHELDTSTKEFSFTSLPNVSLNENMSILNEMKEEITELKALLKIATQEIDKLKSQNTQIKNKMSEYEQELKLFRNMKVDTMNQTETATPIKINAGILSLQHKASTPINLIASTSPALVNHPIPQTNNWTKQHKHNIETMTETTNNLKKTIFILGDQQAMGLYRFLQNSKKYRNQYSVFSFIKPFALCKENLSYCDTLQKSLQNGDKVILAIGANDKNPYNIINALSVSLGKFQRMENVQIYVTQVTNNNFLNENCLNNHIRALVSTYPNCNFVTLNSRMALSESKKLFITNYSLYLAHLSDALKYQMECDDYNSKYLNPKNLNTLIKLNHNKFIKKSCNQPNQHKKGTIPFYFPKQKNNGNIMPSHLYKKGTIPYYFHKQTVNKTSLPISPTNCKSSDKNTAHTYDKFFRS